MTTQTKNQSQPAASPPLNPSEAPPNSSDRELSELREAMAEMQDAIDEILEKIETLSQKETSQNEEINEAVTALETVFKAFRTAEKRARIKIVEPRGDYYGVTFE